MHTQYTYAPLNPRRSGTFIKMIPEHDHDHDPWLPGRMRRADGCNRPVLVLGELRAERQRGGIGFGGFGVFELGDGANCGVKWKHAMQ